MAQKYLDYNGLQYFWGKLKSLFDTKVTNVRYNGTTDTIEMTKSPSTAANPTYTTVVTASTLKADMGLSNVESGAQVNVIEGIQKNGVTISPVNKIVNISIPTKTSDISNDSGFISDDTKGAANGICPLNSNTKVDDTYLPTYVKDVKIGTDTIVSSGIATIPIATSEAPGLVKVSAGNGLGFSNNTISMSLATSSAAGAMTAAEKTVVGSVKSGGTIGQIWTQTSSTAAGWANPVTPNIATNTEAGIMKLYTNIGTATDGTMTQNAIKTAIESAVTGAVAFQGVAPTTFAPTNYKAGYYWVVNTAGTYVGEACEPGDMIFATANYSSAYSASDFDVIQTNLDITTITNSEIDTIMAA